MQKFGIFIVYTDKNPFSINFLMKGIDKRINPKCNAMNYSFQGKLCQISTKIHIYAMLYKSCRFKLIILKKYATNLKTMISQGA